MAATAKKKLLLRSAEGKVFMAPAWDTRLFAQFLPSLETSATTRALEKVIEHWTMHNSAAAQGRADGDLRDWDAKFICRLGEEKGLPEEAHAAAVLLQRKSLADLLVIFTSSKPLRAERPRPCPDDVPTPAKPPRPVPGTPDDGPAPAKRPRHTPVTQRPCPDDVSAPVTPPRPASASGRLRKKVTPLCKKDYSASPWCYSDEEGPLLPSKEEYCFDHFAGYIQAILIIGAPATAIVSEEDPVSTRSAKSSCIK